MAGQSHRFRRLVVGLEPGAPDRTMRLVVELAKLLHVELLGLFLEDPCLRDLAAIPFVREFRPLGGGWRPIELDQLNHDLDVAVRIAERLFMDRAKDLATNFQFEVTREGAAKAFASISRSGDIIAIVERSGPAERATQQFSRLLNAAFESEAAVMLVPASVARIAGPVATIAARPDDPSIYVAAAIAIAANEYLMIVHANEWGTDDDDVNNLAVETGLTIKQTFTGTSLSDPAAYTQALGHVKERLVVMSRGVLAPELVLSIGSRRRVPVLVIAPSDYAPQAQ